MDNKNGMDIFNKEYEDLTEKIEIDDETEKCNNPEIMDVKEKIKKDTDELISDEALNHTKEQDIIGINEEIITDNEQKVESSNVNEQAEIMPLNDKKIENNIKYNNIKVNETSEKLVNDLDRERDNRNNNVKNKRKIKNIILFIGIIIEIVIISLLAYNRFYKQTKTKEYNNKLTCINSIPSSNEDYSVTTNNVYYFDNDKNVTKTQSSMIYIFNNKNSYDKYKNTFVDNKISFYGYDIVNVFDDNNYAYEKRIIYDYKKLKNNNLVNFNNNTFSFKLPDDNQNTTIVIDTYDNIFEQNKNAGIICE